MMRKVNIGKKMFCILLVCVRVCCGCGEREEILVIGGAESPGTEAVPGGETELSGAQTQGTGNSGAQGAQVQKVWIRVYVCGAVKNPGVVEIPEGSRAEDALLAAGGFTEEAGREAVNLADWVLDGQMLYFPTEGEVLEEQIQEAEASAGLVNINTADAAALCTLPGIGESRAADIIAYREKNGGFGSCEDIMKVPGIKTAVYEKICDRITVK